MSFSFKKRSHQKQPKRNKKRNSENLFVVVAVVVYHHFSPKRLQDEIITNTPPRPQHTRGRKEGEKRKEKPAETKE